MEEAKIAKLLHQASFPDMSRDELNGVLEELLQAIPVDRSRPHLKTEIKRELVQEVFWATVERDPRDMPTMLPVFVILLKPAEIPKNRRGSKLKTWERNRDAS